VTTQVCDQCGHVDPHDSGPVVPVPFQAKGTTTRVSLLTAGVRAGPVVLLQPVRCPAGSAAHRARAVNQVIKGRLHYRVIVTLKDGTTFGGVLWETDRQALVLRDAEAITGEQNAPVGVAGELVLLWAEVSYLQRP
jgi:small nuclear ribonucleoprotein (snRNP)-like protein